jgi:hypothetical protein
MVAADLDPEHLHGPRFVTTSNAQRLASGWLLAALLTLTTGCAGFQAATPVSIPALRTATAESAMAQVGYTNAVGVPSLAARMAERPGLKFAVAQVAYAIQGKPEETFVENVQSYRAGYTRVTTWDETTMPQVVVPAGFAAAAGIDITERIEAALVAEGFGVVPYAEVAATAAYQKHYGEYPVGYVIDTEMILDMLQGWTVIGAPPMNVKHATNLIAFGQLNLTWPDAEALAEIGAELGEDVLLLNVVIKAETLAGGKQRKAKLSVGGSLNVNDPKFVGYGIGGFGHAVTALDALTERIGVDVPGFVEPTDGGYRVHWTPLFQDLARVHAAFANGYAAELKRMAYPPTE